MGSWLKISVKVKAFGRGRDAPFGIKYITRLSHHNTCAYCQANNLCKGKPSMKVSVVQSLEHWFWIQDADGKCVTVTNVWQRPIIYITFILMTINNLYSFTLTQQKYQLPCKI